MPVLNFQSIEDAYVSRLKADQNFGGSLELLVGTTILDVHETFIRFDLSSLPLEINITGATMQLFVLANSQSLLTKHIGVHQVLQSWSEKEITFSNKPLSEVAEATGTTVTNQLETYINWNIVDLVKSWHSGALTNNGVMLSSLNPCMTFASREAISVTRRIKPLLVVEYQPAIFVNETDFELTSTDDFQYTTTRNTSGLKMASFFISNRGNNTATVQLEESPDGIVFLAEKPQDVASGNQTVLVPQFFTQFARVAYKSTVPDAPTVLDIWFQGQGR